MEQLTKQIIEVAKEAGRLIYETRDFEVEEKTDNANIVTTMDRKSQELILSRLAVILPEAKVIAEEDEVFSFDDGYVWIVDPIDGTTNYAYDCKYSCVSIALLNHNETIIGVVYNPYLDELFYAEKNNGAFLNNTPINVSNNDISSSLIVVGTSPYKKENADYTFDTFKKLFLQARDLRRTGSAVLDLCFVACGRFDAFYESSLAPWDFSAASLIVKEAGGVIDAIAPDTWCYTKSIGVIAGTKHNFDKLKEITQR